MGRELNQPTWTTNNEIDHIKSIIDGSCFTEKSPFVWPGPEHMLRGYLAGCKIRHDWGSMDSKKIIKFAQEQLNAFD